MSVRRGLASCIAVMIGKCRDRKLQSILPQIVWPGSRQGFKPGPVTRIECPRSILMARLIAQHRCHETIRRRTRLLHAMS